jgi:hypothetical protein
MKACGNEILAGRERTRGSREEEGYRWTGTTDEVRRLRIMNM